MSLSSSLSSFTSPRSYSRPVYDCFFLHSGTLPDLLLPNHASPSLPLLSFSLSLAGSQALIFEGLAIDMVCL